MLKHIQYLHEQTIELRLEIIRDETALLNNVRRYEYEKNLNHLSYLKCLGEDTVKLDSIKILLDQANSYIKLRDSIYIATQFEKLREYGNL